MMIHVKLAPPTLGAWSIAGLLGQPLEYYAAICSYATMHHIMPKNYAGIIHQDLPVETPFLFLHAAVLKRYTGPSKHPQTNSTIDSYPQLVWSAASVWGSSEGRVSWEWGSTAWSCSYWKPPPVVWRHRRYSRQSTWRDGAHRLTQSQKKSWRYTTFRKYMGLIVV